MTIPASPPKAHPSLRSFALHISHLQRTSRLKFNAGRKMSLKKPKDHGDEPLVAEALPQAQLPTPKNARLGTERHMAPLFRGPRLPLRPCWASVRALRRSGIGIASIPRP